MGLALSVLFHVVLFIWLYRTIIAAPEAGEPVVRGARPAPSGTQIVQLEEVAGPVSAPAPTAPSQRAPARRPRVTPAPGQGAAERAVPGAGAVVPRGSGMDALRVPKDVDPRLYVDPDALPPAPSDMERVESRIAGRLKAYNDSVTAAAEAAERALDWTIHGKDGSRWGIAPDGIHLGKLTLPAPSFGGNAEGRARAREWSDIQDQASRAEVRDRFKDRVKAIRERKEKERADEKKKESGSHSGSGSGQHGS